MTDRAAIIDRLLEERTSIAQAGGDPARLRELDERLARFTARPTRDHDTRPETRGA